MLTREVAMHAISFINGALSTALYSGVPTGDSSRLTALAVGVAITAVAGVAVAAAVGGSVLYTRRVRSRRRKKRKPLTPVQWRDAFHAETGLLIDTEKLLNKIRFRGLDPSVRAEVWPFLLGLFQLESTRAEREVGLTSRREEYGNLRRKCMFVMMDERTRDKFRNDEITKNELPVADLHNDLGSSLPEHEESDSILVNNCTEAETHMDDSYLDSDKEVHLNQGKCSSFDGKLVKPIDIDGSYINPSIEVPEEFSTWRRIIRLDAVRMNAEWIPYSPSQANISMEVGNEVAQTVDLKDYEHLEPCRRHHAARLVSILEAYALYDKEIGYCQGMSDLLSPFVALLDDDCEAFWCFAYFMNTTRQNFRIDEVGIRRQLNMLSEILKLSDPHLYQYLEKIHAEECFFMYRMVVVLLRRELSFEQTISLWEVIWADRAAARRVRGKASWRKGRRAPPTNHLLLYVIACAVIQRRKIIMEKCKGIDDIFRLCNSMTGYLDIWELLDDARGLVKILHDKITD